jgi:predicted phage baseplate assembly protein
MSLPTRNLDDRTFQDIVDEAKKRIVASCPEWTDHNVSDPGVTLIELFAWMTEMVIYRLNQVPEKHYIKLLELLGYKLREPEAAQAEITFYLASPQPHSIVIDRDTEVATIRTATRNSIVFSTDADLEIHPPRLTALITREMPASPQDEPEYSKHNLQHLGITGFSLTAFGRQPSRGDALYFGFEPDLSKHVLGLELTCVMAAGLGIDPLNPPWQWEAWHGGEGNRRWLPAVVESDSTGGMNQSGLIRLRLPHMAQRDFGGQRAYWLRCRVIEAAVPGQNYDHSPQINNVVPSSWGGSVWATNDLVVRKEVLGRSDGSPGQVFYVEHKPLLRRARGETIEAWDPNEKGWVAWTEVSNFSESQPTDKHFICDSITGEVRFGPALREPEGLVHSYGVIPPRGSQIRFSRYRYGGGVAGNVKAKTLTVLKSSNPYVSEVTNHAPATGGVDPESIELAQLRAPQLLRSRERAVTPADYEALAREADTRVCRARCVQPAGTGARTGPLAGQIHLLLVPEVNQPEWRIRPEQLHLQEELCESVRCYLDNYRLLTVDLDIGEPKYVKVAVDTEVVINADARPERVREEVERQLYRFLNPIKGGPAGEGWPFGRDLYPSDVYTCLQAVRGIQYIKALQLYRVHSSGDQREISGCLKVPANGLIVSAVHQVTCA